jgi:tRNA 2-thiocytidine biosynthesis protein TtcA
MLPVQEFFEGKLVVIRPFFMLDEDIIARHARSMGWPQIELGCPTAGSSKRETVRQMLKQFYRANGKIKGNIFHAMQNVRTDYLP